MLTTNDEELARKLKALRIHGSFEKYVHQWPGMNSRLDALQAAVLDVKLDHLDDWNRARQRNAAIYRETLSDVVTTPAAGAVSDQPCLQSIRDSLPAAG